MRKFNDVIKTLSSGCSLDKQFLIVLQDQELWNLKRKRLLLKTSTNLDPK